MSKWVVSWGTRTEIVDAPSAERAKRVVLGRIAPKGQHGGRLAIEGGDVKVRQATNVDEQRYAEIRECEKGRR